MDRKIDKKSKIIFFLNIETIYLIDFGLTSRIRDSYNEIELIL